MNIFTRIGVWIGFIETELHHVTDIFHSFAAKLEGVAARKEAQGHALITTAQDMRSEADAKLTAAFEALNSAGEARVIAENIKTLVSPIGSTVATPGGFDAVQAAIVDGPVGGSMATGQAAYKAA